MLYMGEEHLREVGESWSKWVDRIQETVRIMDQGDYAQPLKPYLRYGDPANRIIAMPAYIGGSVGVAGLKWIASFPGNRSLGLPRAHSVTILNDASTGAPRAILHTALVSAVRTAAVSGLMLREWLGRKLSDPTCEQSQQRLRIGIIGLGPIGRMHLSMCQSLFAEHIEHIMLYDIQGIKEQDLDDSRYRIAGSWQELYTNCNVIITCTVSPERYINIPPAPGTLLLDVSLRDYCLEAIQGIRSVVVDDWNEVCRENTDIELLHLHAGLTENGAVTLRDVICRGALDRLSPREPLLFCPMGMATFDVAIADWYVDMGKGRGIGISLS
ncbi:2,3-diaminopropionate biosynthesis protein SbnB [Paenibacillus sp. strain BS8-2]